MTPLCNTSVSKWALAVGVEVNFIGNAVASNPLLFKTRLHEDIFRIAEMMKGKLDLDGDEATAFAVGLKLFGEAMLKDS